MSTDVGATARLQALHDRLVSAVESIHSGEDWSRMLAVAARLHSYSTGNLLLLMSQAAERGWDTAEIGPFGGYRMIQSIGRQVRKGEQGLVVLAPVLRRASMTNRGHDYIDPEDDIPRPVLVGFRVVHVFDIHRQSEGDPLPEPPAPELLQGEGPAGLIDALTAQIQTAGFAVSYGPLQPANGVTDYATRTVTIADRLSPAARAKTLCHELAHVTLGHGDQLQGGCRGRLEVEAESVAFLVASRCHLEASAYSFPYVARWASDAGVVQAAAERVIGAARDILGRIEVGAGPVPLDNFAGLPRELMAERGVDLAERARAVAADAARAERRRQEAARARHAERRERGYGIER